MERVDSLKRKFESQKLENESNKMRKLPSLLNIETRPNVKNETHKHQMFIRHVSVILTRFEPGPKVSLFTGKIPGKDPLVDLFADPFVGIKKH